MVFRKEAWFSEKKHGFQKRSMIFRKEAWFSAPKAALSIRRKGKLSSLCSSAKRKNLSNILTS